jgi:hypothetical protein
LAGFTLSATASASATRRLFVFTRRLLFLKVNPPVIVRDAAADVLLVVVVEVRRQDHRLGLRLGSLASHAT